MKTVLVALDRTPDATSLLARAVAMAGPFGAKLLVLGVVDVPLDLPPPGSLLIQLPTSGRELVAATRQHLLRLAADIPEALRGDVLVETGEPASVICRVAKEQNADLVVIGARQHGPLRRALGTTAARVVDHIDRPVIVMRGMS